MILPVIMVVQVYPHVIGFSMDGLRLGEVVIRASIQDRTTVKNDTTLFPRLVPNVSPFE